MPWPKGKPRGPRKPVDPLREPVVEPGIGHNSGRVVVRGRDGEELTRKRRDSSDIFHIPPEIVPENWGYQWNTVTVYEQPQTAQILAMRENGWRPVPAGRHKGMFMPADTPDDAEILRDGMRLEERPMALINEAKAEELAKANVLMSDQKEQLGLVQRMPEGFSRDNPNLRRMERQGTSRTYAPAPDAPRARLPIES